MATGEGGVDGVDGVYDVVGHPNLGSVGAVCTGSEHVGLGELVEYLRCPACGDAVGVLDMAGRDGRGVNERVQDMVHRRSGPASRRGWINSQLALL